LLISVAVSLIGDPNWKNKLKLRTFDKLFNKARYNNILKIIHLRNQVRYMVKSFEDIPIERQIMMYRQTHMDIYKYILYNLDEVRMFNDLGIQAVIDRLTGDRNFLINVLKDVNDVDISDISKQVRDEKINVLLNEIV